jgi:para-nitrobenzyl esterase
MRHTYIITLCCLLFSANLVAQCPVGRYQNQVFPTINMSTVTYSTPYSLQMDIYQPAGDTLTARPIIILAHGGSFISGTRNDDSTIVKLCRNFAKRGYVTASIDYRLSNLGAMVSSDSTQPIDEVAKAIGDGKAAIRFFMQDAATTNTYKIDTNNIFIGGNSAGAVLYMHVGYLDSIQECPAYIASALAANGGFEGNSGNPGYTTRSKAIINLAGGLNEVSFVGPGDKPSVNAQGDNDAVVPYTCGYPNFGTTFFPVYVNVKLCGLGSLEPAYVSNSISHMSHVFPGQGHVPWSSNTGMFNTVDSMITVFLYSQVCTNVSSVNEVNANTEVSVFPNPAGENVYLQSAEPVSGFTMYDPAGRVVKERVGINERDVQVNTAHLSKGMYLIRIRFTDENNAPVIRRIVIQ